MSTEHSTLLDYVEQGSTPAPPASGYWRFYAKADGFYVQDAAGTEVGPLAVGGGGGSVGLAPDDGTLSLAPAGWWRADTLSGSDGAAVGTWPDSSGNGRDATQSTAGKKPLLRQAAVNGLTALQFDGSNDTLTATVAVSGATTVIAVLVRLGLATQMFLDFHSGGYLHLLYDTAGNKVRLVAGSNPDPLFALATLTPGLPLLLALRYDGSAVADAYQNATRVTKAATSAVTATGAWFGSDTDAGTYFDGYFCEVVWYAGALTLPELIAVIQYLEAKWGV